MSSMNYLRPPNVPTALWSTYPQSFAAPSNLSNSLGGLPPYSNVNTKPNEEVNVSVNHYIRTVPMPWTSGFQQGFPMFVNTEFPAGGPAHLMASLPMVNYYLEEGARLRYLVETSHNEREREKAEETLTNLSHLYGKDGSVESALSTWRFYGVMLNMIGKTSDGIFSWSESTDPEPVIQCTVQKRAVTKNIWGTVRVGDRLYMRLTRVPLFLENKGLMSPDGTITQPAGPCPPTFLQWTPVIYPRPCNRPSHLTDSSCTKTGGEGSLDFMEPNVKTERFIRTVKFTEEDKDHPGQGSLQFDQTGVTKGPYYGVHDVWTYGGMIPMGTVLRVGANNRCIGGLNVFGPLRDQNQLTALDTVEILLGVL